MTAARLFMLDTNVLSDLIREPEGPIADQIAQVGESAVCCSIIVAAELRYGAARRKAKQLTARVDAALSAIDILPLGEPVGRVYGALRAKLATRGTPVGPNDLLIAAHALSENLTLVTDNHRKFARIDGLALANWRERH